MATKTAFFMRLDPETHKRLERLAYQHRRSIAFIVRDCIEVALPQVEKRLATASRKRLQEMRDEIDECQRRLDNPVLDNQLSVDENESDWQTLSAGKKESA
jgi:predicted DNA-binding protein